MRDRTILKQTKWFISLAKEKLWLEQRALSGWFLSDIRLGIRYIFVKDEPKRMIYEIDRFDLPKNPTLKDIRHKQEFLDMAGEMGWSPLLHDEDLNYYFCKEYKEGEINELYNDLESRQLHALKYLNRYKRAGTLLIKLAFAMGFFGVAAVVIGIISTPVRMAFIIFVLAYEIFCLGSCLLCEDLAVRYYIDLLMTAEELKELQRDKVMLKTICRVFFTMKGLRKYLENQGRAGYHLIKASILQYVFMQGEPGDYLYTMDSRYLTNLRRKERGGKTFSSRKDWGGLNNDWQVQSLKEAEKKDWNFVCALQNWNIIYRSRPNGEPGQLNHEKYEKGIHGITWFGKLVIFFAICFLLGVAAGFIAACLGF